MDGPNDVLSQGYDEQFDPPAPKDYECPICLFILREPMQTECGHLFCGVCILNVVREVRPNCPIDNEILEESQIFPDNYVKRKILGLNVHCHNYNTRGCPWLDSLKNLEAHMDICNFSIILCPWNCGTELQRNNLQYHLDEECIQRIVECFYCGCRMTYQTLTGRHYERCTQFGNTRRRNTMELDGTRQNVELDDSCYDEQFDPPPPDCYLCGICKKVPKIPMQADCGHLFCQRCTRKAIGERPLNCPIDNEISLSEDMIHKDNFVRKEIVGLKVHCHNYKTHGCPWLESLKDLPSHMESCEFSVIRCPNNCGEELQRKKLQYHLDEECVRRIVACLYCDQKVVYRTLMEHHEKCPLKTTACPYACGDEFVWEELATHCGSQCSIMRRKCQFSRCNFQGTQIEIEEHNKMHEHHDSAPSDQCSASG